MEFVALAFALLAFAVASAALRKARAQAQAIDEAAAGARRTAQNAASEIGAALEVQRKLLARVVAGEKLTPEMVLEGQLWRDVSQDEARRMIETERALVLLDVRTPGETRAGIIPGARLIPIDELEARAKELPRQDAPILAYCAGGGRSAAACEFLARQGFERLHNLEGGFQSWTGPRANPSA